jgi:hypothetical protein
MASTSSKISDVQRYDGGVLIVYADGKHFIYSGEILREIASKARDVTPAKTED